MNEQSMTVRGKERYKSGVMQYKKMGYWEPDYTPKDTDIIALFRVTRRKASIRSRRRRRSPVNPRRRPGRWCGPIA